MQQTTPPDARRGGKHLLIYTDDASAGIGTHNANPQVYARLPGLHRAGPSTPLDEAYSIVWEV
jgi:hypothetical protein